jgi:quercetin dioxygenase-like cupin family protein
VAGGNHVTLLLHRDETQGALDVIEVLAQPGGGPPPHRHEFAEWFQVREGELTITQEVEGAIRPRQVLRAGQSIYLPPWAWHGTLNLSGAPARFEVVGLPGAMTGYFVQAGVAVTDELTAPGREPAGPAQLREISARWGIEFWTGPIESE